MKEASAILAELDRMIGEAPPEELATLVGRLEQAKTQALARMVVPRPYGGDPVDQNLSAEEAARRLGVSRDWLYKTMLPFKVKIGRRVLFSARGLDRWNRQRVGR